MMNCKNRNHYGSDFVAVENSEGWMTAACRMCVEESTRGFMGVEVDYKQWGPEEKTIQRNLFNKWFSAMLLDQKSCLIRDVLRNQKENLWSEWQKVKPYESGG
jgi:hypothetical protein